MVNIIRSKKEQRIAHWQEISKRVTTHEGEFLSGNKGREYQIKYSKKYLGKDLSKPININPDRPEVKKELNK